jgi:hypothetical protein
MGLLLGLVHCSLVQGHSLRSLLRHCSLFPGTCHIHWRFTTSPPNYCSLYCSLQAVKQPSLTQPSALHEGSFTKSPCAHKQATAEVAAGFKPLCCPQHWPAFGTDPLQPAAPLLLLLTWLMQSSPGCQAAQPVPAQAAALCVAACVPQQTVGPASHVTPLRFALQNPVHPSASLTLPKRDLHLPLSPPPQTKHPPAPTTRTFCAQDGHLAPEVTASPV